VGAFPFLSQAGAWGPGASDEDAPSVVELIRAGTMDAELASLLWLLVEARVPVIVAAGPRGAGKTTVLRALLDFLPPGVSVRHLEGFAEDFRWLPEAPRLGWRSTADGSVGRVGPTALSGAAAPSDQASVAPATTYLVASEFSPHLPFYTWGEQARIAIRALSVGYGLGATIHADSLEGVFEELRGPGVGVTEDELSHLGVVLVLSAFRFPHGTIARRVVAAHYVRPVSRDSGGHVQRQPPAVLATSDAASDSFEHFAWGVTADLAGRTGRKAGDFEAEQERRRDVLSALAVANVSAVPDVRAAIEGYRLAPAHSH
jgi:hypothetical protein